MTPEHDGEITLLGAVAHAERTRSYLEIGARYGISLQRVASFLPKRSRVVAVDLPGGPWGRADSIVQLRGLIADLRKNEYDAHLIEGDSRDPEVIEEVRALGPYDLCYIDGDHTYEGVSADWSSYGPMSRVVAFDDIWSANDKKYPDGRTYEMGCPRFWTEVRESRRYLELAGTAKRNHGIGIVWSA